MIRQRHAAYSPAEHERLDLGLYAAVIDTTMSVRITANFNAGNAPVLVRKVRDAIATEGVTHVTIDLRHCPKIDRRGLEGLASVAGDVRRAGGVVTVTNASDELRLQFAWTSVDRLFVMEPKASEVTP